MRVLLKGFPLKISLRFSDRNGFFFLISLVSFNSSSFRTAFFFLLLKISASSTLWLFVFVKRRNVSLLKSFSLPMSHVLDS